MPKHAITTLDWWTAAGQRAAYTALVVLLPYAAFITTGRVPIVEALLAVGLALVVSLVTSLAGLPEVTGRDVPWWLAILVRVTKTAAQTVVASVGSAVLLTDVDWHTVWLAVASAAMGTLIRTLRAYLPEAAGTIDARETTGIPVITSAGQPTHIELGGVRYVPEQRPSTE